jgi:hypothetical protein
MSGLLYGKRDPHQFNGSLDFSTWLQNNQMEFMPKLPKSLNPPFAARIIFESQVIYSLPFANECSGVVAVGCDEDNQQSLWSILYWGPARGGLSQRRLLYNGFSMATACQHINDQLIDRLRNKSYVCDGPLRLLSPIDQLG